MLYSVQEIFYSIQGEGQWTGQPMVFIRLAGCNLNCSFCDTVWDKGKAMSTEEIVQEVKKYPARRVVLTGGEPLLQPLQELLVALREFEVHLETNGTQPLRDVRNLFNWIAISPKSPVDSLSDETFSYADEVKFLCGPLDLGLLDWKEYIDQVMRKTQVRFTARLYLTPTAKSKDFYKGLGRSREEIIDKNVEAAKAYCLKNPEFSLCLQMHKFIGIL